MALKLKSSLRMKKRYFLIEGNKKEVEKIILDYIGILGWARAGIIFVDISDLDKKYVVISVDRKEVNNVRAAFEASTEKASIVRVSGTLRKLY